MYDSVTQARGTRCEDRWLETTGDVCEVELGVGGSAAEAPAAEAPADWRRRQDADELVAERTRADAVQREVDAVVETIRDRGDVLCRQQAAVQTTRGARRRGRVEADVVEEQSQPADAVRNVENDERGRDDKQQVRHVVITLTTVACGSLGPACTKLGLLVVMMMMTVMMVVE